jgi:carotenoid 1,2-hydratase
MVAMQRSFWGLKRATRSEGAARVTQTLEDAPFYGRAVVGTRWLGRDLTAMHENLSLDRFDTPWMRLMLPFKAPRALSILRSSS